jgi:phosphoribosylaminoimidazole-succinocarboxamide synthase
MTTTIYRGSVKDIKQVISASDTAFGTGWMEFRDDGSYSIFDYGTMPWGIQGKGGWLYRTSLEFFRVLEEEGMETHYIADLGDRKIKIQLARMPQSYGEIVPGETVVYRVPIECIYSRVVTPVSSFHKRLRSGRAKPEDFGLARPPERGETIILPETRTTFSTKIEAVDVYKDLATLAGMGGLIGDEPEQLRALTVKGGEALMRYGDERGVVVADGKLEFLLGPGRELIAGDTGLSWDENRLLVDIGGVWVDVSKQLPRNIYTIAAYEWKQALKQAQHTHPDNQERWPEPPDIDTRYKDLCMDACSVVSAQLAGEDVRPDLREVGTRVFEALENLKQRYGRDETGEPL